MANPRNNSTKRNVNSNLTKTQRMLEENDMKVEKTVAPTPVKEVSPVQDESSLPNIWMLSPSDIRRSSPALAKWNDGDLNPTIKSVESKLLADGASIADGVVIGIDPVRFNKICNVVISEIHRKDILEYLEKHIRVDVVEIIGSGLKEPELTALVDTMALKCFTLNIDVGDGDDYNVILDSFIDPVVDQLNADAVEAETRAEQHQDLIGAETADIATEPLAEVPEVIHLKIDEDSDVVEVSIEHTEAVNSSFVRQALIDPNQPLDQTSNTLRATDAGGEVVTLSTMVDGKVIKLDEVTVEKIPHPYKGGLIELTMAGSIVLVAAADEFFEYRNAAYQKEVVKDVLSDLVVRHDRHCNRPASVYLPFNGLQLGQLMSEQEIFRAIWGSTATILGGTLLYTESPVASVHVTDSHIHLNYLADGFEGTGEVNFAA